MLFGLISDLQKRKCFDVFCRNFYVSDAYRSMDLVASLSEAAVSFTRLSSAVISTIQGGASITC